MQINRFLWITTIFVSLITLFSYEVRAKDLINCEKKMLSKYFEYRKSLLLSDFEVDNVTQYFRKNYLEDLKVDKVFEHFMLLRVKEARISRIVSYQASCKNALVLRLKVDNFDLRYGWREVWFLEQDGKFVINGYSDEKNKYLDKKLKFIEIKSQKQKQPPENPRSNIQVHH